MQFLQDHLDRKFDHIYRPLDDITWCPTSVSKSCLQKVSQGKTRKYGKKCSATTLIGTIVPLTHAPSPSKPPPKSRRRKRWSKVARLEQKAIKRKWTLPKTKQSNGKLTKEQYQKSMASRPKDARERMRLEQQAALNPAREVASDFSYLSICENFEKRIPLSCPEALLFRQCRKHI